MFRNKILDPKAAKLKELQNQKAALETELANLNERNNITEVFGKKAEVNSGENLTINASQITSVSASMQAEKDLNLTSENINIMSESLRNRTAALGSDNYKNITDKTTNHASEISAENVNINAKNQATFVSSDINANQTTINANTLNFIANKNVDFYHKHEESSNLLTQTVLDESHHKENLVFNNIAGTLNINANQITATTNTAGNYGNFTIDGEVTKTEAKEEDRKWYTKTTTLSAVAAMVIAIAVLTSGADLGLFATMMMAAATTIGTIATITGINSLLNGSNIFEAHFDSVKSAFKEETLKAAAISGVVAGAGKLMGDYIAQTKADYVKSHPEAKSWMEQGNSNLKSGTMENSKIGVNVEYKTNPITNKAAWYREGTWDRTNWLETYVMGTGNPLLKTLNLVPRMQSFSHFHDASMGMQNAGQLWTSLSIAPYLPISYAASTTNLQLMFNNIDAANKANNNS